MRYNGQHELARFYLVIQFCKGEYKMKKILTLVLAASFIFGAAVPVLAQNGDYSLEEYFTPASTRRLGYIAEVTEDSIKVADQLDDGYETSVLNLHPGTIIIDAATGMPATLEERENDRVLIFYREQSKAAVVVLNLAEYGAAPNYHVIEEVEMLEDDTLRITADGGSLHIYVDRETPLSPHLTRQMIQLEHLQPGDTILAWYGFVGMSFPGQARAERILFLGHGEQDEYETGYENGVDYITDNYYPADDYYQYDYQYEYQLPYPIAEAVKGPVSGEGRMKYGVEFFAVRKYATQAGYIVTWDEENNQAVLTNAGRTILLSVGSVNFYVNGAQTDLYTLPKGAFIENGVMYAPYEFFAAL